MTPSALAATHKAAFGNAGWSTADFDSYNNDTKIHIFGDAMCFAVIRVIGPEAEILTLATRPDSQGRGLATSMLRDAMAKLIKLDVEDVFLDVKETNAPAIALYLRAGFTTFSTRSAYYADGASAICMKAELSAASFA